MDSKCFTEVVEDGIKWTEDVLMEKAGVYQFGRDRLSNFKAAGRMDAVTPERALWGMALKHRVKLDDIISTIGLTGDLPSKEQLRETTGDLRNYLHLLEALITERINEVEKLDAQLPENELRRMKAQFDNSFVKSGLSIEKSD